MRALVNNKTNIYQVIVNISKLMFIRLARTLGGSIGHIFFEFHY